MKSSTYTEQIDFILVLLRNIRTVNPKVYVSLVQMLKITEIEMSFGEIQELAKYLETKGWAKVINMIGDIRIQITTNGLLYLENKDDKFFAAYEKFKLQKTTNKSKEDLLITVFENPEDPKKELLDLIDKIKLKIVDIDKGGDFTKDLDIIKIELSKLNPDLRLIEIKLNSLTTINIISSEIQELRDYLNQE